jgi:cytochrome c
LKALLLVAALAAGDPEAGAAVYSRCLGCHSLEMNRTGPKHCELFGRRAGAVPGFEYSPAMQRSTIVWNERTLERFLADPASTVPGTAMTYAGVPDAQDRADLIAYLKRQRCGE